MLKKALFFIGAILLLGGVFIYEDLSKASLTQPDEEIYNLKEMSEEGFSGEADDDFYLEDLKEAEKGEGGNVDSCLTEINKLSVSELKLIDGVGEAYSQKISEAEDIKTAEDLKEISGIGTVTAENIKEFVCNDLNEIADKDEGVKNGEEDFKEDESKKDKEKIKLTEKELEELLIKINQLQEKGTTSQEAVEEDNTDSSHVEINEATKNQLKKLTGIGPAYAEKIIQKRPFCSLEELKNISGIGEKTLENIKDQGLALVGGCKDGSDLPDEDGKVKGYEKEKTKIEEEKRKEIEDLEEEISFLREDYSDLRRSLREKENKLKEVEDELKIAQRQRDRCVSSEQININKADKDELKNLPNVGDSRAKSIYKADEFETLEDVGLVDGIGEQTITDWIEDGLACSWSDEDESSEEEDGDEDQGTDNGGFKVDINNADKDRLKDIHGIGSSIAQKIIDYRKDNYFCSLEDLISIDGIGETTIEEIKSQEVAYIDSEKMDVFNCIKIPEMNLKYAGDDKEKSKQVEINNEMDQELDLQVYKDGLIDKDLQLTPEENSFEITFNVDRLSETVEKRINLKIKEKESLWPVAFKLEEDEGDDDEEEDDEDDEEFENLVKNPLFKDWEGGKLLDWSWDHRGGPKGENPLIDGLSYFEHEPYSDSRDLTQKLETDKDDSYKINLWTKGEGRLRVGLKDLNSDEIFWSNYEYKNIDSKSWKKLNFEVDEKIKEAKLIIRITRLKETGESFSLGAVWLGSGPPPEVWPTQ